MRAYAVTRPGGGLSIVRLTPQKAHFREDFDSDEDFDLAVADATNWQPFKLPKTLFELSRTTDGGHFNIFFHTEATIAAGLPGHVPLAAIEIDDQTDLPEDRTQRDDWEIFGGSVRVKPA